MTTSNCQARGTAAEWQLCTAFNRLTGPQAHDAGNLLIKYYYMATYKTSTQCAPKCRFLRGARRQALSRQLAHSLFAHSRSSFTLLLTSPYMIYNIDDTTTKRRNNISISQPGPFAILPSRQLNGK